MLLSSLPQLVLIIEVGLCGHLADSAFTVSSCFSVTNSRFSFMKQILALAVDIQQWPKA